MADHTPTPWKWHPKSEQDERNGSIYSEQRPGHTYAVAMQPRYAGDVQWREDAAFIVKAVNSHEANEAKIDALVKALEPFAALADAVFAKYEMRPGELVEAYHETSDDQNIWGFNRVSLTYGHLRAARAALKASETGR